MEARINSKVAALDVSSSGPNVVELRERIVAALARLGDGLVERDTEVRLLLLAALSGEHILYLGPPGTAKSEMSRRLASVLGKCNYFERLLTRFSVPEELFGPLSMRALERDMYERKTTGYLPEVRSFSVSQFSAVPKFNHFLLIFLFYNNSFA